MIKTLTDRLETIKDVGLVLPFADVQSEVAIINLGIVVQFQGQFHLGPKCLANLGANVREELR